MAKLTQSVLDLLFFCNPLFPKEREKKSDQDAYQQRRDEREIKGEIAFAIDDISRKSAQPGNFMIKK